MGENIEGTRRLLFRDSFGNRTVLASCSKDENVSNVLLKMFKRTLPDLGINELAHFSSPEKAIGALRGPFSERVALVISSRVFNYLAMFGAAENADSMDGAELASAIREEASLSEIPVILHSSTGPFEEDSHFDGFIPKPYCLPLEIRKIISGALLKRLRQIGR